MTTNWREYATPEAQQAFADAQARLDEGDYPDGEAGHKMMRADEKLTDRYDRLVLQPAQWERIVEDDNAEFARHFPEPPDGSRVEWEYDGFLWAAYRQDQADGNGDWWLYGRDDDCYSWRRLVVEYHIRMADLTVLVDAESLRKQVAQDIASAIEAQAEKVKTEAFNPSAGVALAAVLADGARIAREYGEKGR